MKIAIAQLSATPDKNLNLEKAIQYIKKAKGGDSDFIIFPEMYMARIPMDSEMNPAKIAESLDGPFVKGLTKAAAHHQIYIVCGIHEKIPENESRAYNTVITINKSGEIISSYRKTHLCDAWGSKESDKFVPGPEPFKVLDTEHGRIGLIICYELRFPEISRKLALNNIDFLFVPSAWYQGILKEDHWKVLLRARAIENSIYVIASNQTSSFFSGRSMIVDPMGTVIADAGEEEGLIFSDVDPNRITRVREKLPSLVNRKEKLYI